MHLNVYLYTRQTCTHCGPSVRKATSSLPSASPSHLFQAAGKYDRGFSLAGGRRDYAWDAKNQIKSRNLLTARFRNALKMSLARLPPPRGRRCRCQRQRGGTVFFSSSGENGRAQGGGKKVCSLSLGGRCFSETGRIKGEILIPDSFSTSCCASPLYCSKGPW